jgi:uncharacterized iron-regulated membrane protein
MDQRLDERHAHGQQGPKGVAVAEGPLTAGTREWRAKSESPRRRFWFVFSYQGHRWTGLILALFAIVISVTGIMLNHKRAIGIMIEPSHKPSAPLAEALPLAALLDRAIEAFAHPSYGTEKSVNRMDFRPGRGYIKVRFRDPENTEVILDTATGAVLSIAPRDDVFYEQLHSGELFGGDWVILSDIAGVAIIFLASTGFYLWLRPYLRRRRAN